MLADRRPHAGPSSARGPQQDRFERSSDLAGSPGHDPHGIPRPSPEADAAAALGCPCCGHGPARSCRTGPLEVDVAAAVVRLDGRAIRISANELRVLLALAARPGQLVPYAEIADAVWGTGVFAVSPRYWQHGLRVTVSRLRRRLGRAGVLIVPVIGLGLRLDIIAWGEPLPSAVHPRTLAMRGQWATDWAACRGCGGTDLPHNGRGYCTGCHGRASRGTLGQGQRWSRGYACCQGCGEIERPHSAHGYCATCYDRIRRHTG